MGDWIQTFTGKAFYPLAPHRNEYDIRDIAHALSLKCRFSGHCSSFYSVAEHSLRVAAIVAPESKAWAMLHDAAEAYLPDICRPIKSDIWVGEAAPFDWETPGQHEKRYSEVNGKYFRTFKCAENELLDAIAKTFGLPQLEGGLLPADVHQADLILLATEARDLMGNPPLPWDLRVPVLPDRIEPMAPAEAESLFLRSFESAVAFNRERQWRTEDVAAI